MVTGGVEIPVAGVTFEERQSVLECLYGLQQSGETLMAELVREPGNVHDRNAIQVFIKGLQVGYVPRLTALALAPLMDGGGTVRVTGAHVIHGGNSKITFGARVDVEVEQKEVG